MMSKICHDSSSHITIRFNIDILTSPTFNPSPLLYVISRADVVTGFFNPVETIYRSGKKRWATNDTVKWFEEISAAQSLIKPAGGNLSLITASLPLTAHAATQPAGMSNGHLDSQSISRPVSLVWLGRVPWCQPVCQCRRTITLPHIHDYSSFKSL